jgi:DNA ligase-associated metallophosphoesterase
LVENRFGKINLEGEDLVVLPEKALYWEGKKSLIIADTHIGKADHFRKAGLPIPDQASTVDYCTLDTLLETYDVDRIIIVGDMFHSNFNNACSDFITWKNTKSLREVVLVKGNHDILGEKFYRDGGIVVYNEEYIESPYTFTHKPPAVINHGYYISGHIHPAVRMGGKGRQSLTLSCFIFGLKQALLPAFGSLTGKCIVLPEKSDKVFVIGSDKVFEVK